MLRFTDRNLTRKRKKKGRREKEVADLPNLLHIADEIGHRTFFV